MSLPKTRQSLIIEMRNRSNDAWQEFLEIYEQAIVNFCKKRSLQEADALDVTQEVLASVEKKIGSWDLEPRAGKFRAWLFCVARNIAADKVMERSRKIAATGDSRINEKLNEFADPSQNQSAAFWQEYRTQLIHWAAERIKPEVKATSWQSFWMTAIEGHKPEDVATLLNQSVGSVYAAKFRIVSRIREIISRLDTDENDSESKVKITDTTESLGGNDGPTN